MSSQPGAARRWWRAISVLLLLGSRFDGHADGETAHRLYVDHFVEGRTDDRDGLAEVVGGVEPPAFGADRERERRVRLHARCLLPGFRVEDRDPGVVKVGHVDRPAIRAHYH